MPDCSSSSQEVELVSDVSISTSGYSEEDFGCTEGKTFFLFLLLFFFLT